MNVGFLRADWLAPHGVRAGCTLRAGGVEPGAVRRASISAITSAMSRRRWRSNRALLRAELQLPAEPLWLQQVHGTRVRDADAADGAGPGPMPPSRASGDRVLAVLVADCMPVLFASADGAVVGAAHAGWRGLAAGVLERTVAAMDAAPGGMHAWLGPAIGAQHFEVGEEVRAAFLAARCQRELRRFAANARGRWQCDLRAAGAQRGSRRWA